MVKSAEAEVESASDVEDQVKIESEPGTQQTPREARDQNRKRQPRYHVVLWDDNDHSYDYVIRMLQELFGHSYSKGYLLAREVDKVGRTICLTTTLEHAELKRDQIHSYGKDQRIRRSAGSMSCTLEPAE